MSQCVFVPSGYDPSRERWVYHCNACGSDVRVRRQGAVISQECKANPAPIPVYGPGTEAHALVLEYGFSSAGCGGCQAAIDMMNRWGVEGCRVPNNRAWIIAQLEESAKRIGLAAKLSAGIVAVREGLPLTIPGLVDEAIRRAEASAVARPSIDGRPDHDN